MSQTLTLSRLQKVDLQRDQIENRLKTIERALQDDVHLRTARQRDTETEKALNDARSALKDAEQAVQAQTIKIKEVEAALYGGRVRNPKELQDLQKDLAALRRYLATLEDQQLNAMLMVDETQAAHHASHTDLDSAQADYSTKNAELIAQRESLHHELETIAAERQAIAQSVPTDLLQTYEELRIQRRGVAVASVVDQSCAACGAELTPADCQAARSPTRIIYCPSCGRILYGG